MSPLAKAIEALSASELVRVAKALDAHASTVSAKADREKLVHLANLALAQSACSHEDVTSSGRDSAAAVEFLSLAQVAEFENLTASAIRRRIRANKYPNARKLAGSWFVPVTDIDLRN